MGFWLRGFLKLLAKQKEHDLTWKYHSGLLSVLTLSFEVHYTWRPWLVACLSDWRPVNLILKCQTNEPKNAARWLFDIVRLGAAPTYARQFKLNNAWFSVLSCFTAWCCLIFFGKRFVLMGGISIAALIRTCHIGSSCSSLSFCLVAAVWRIQCLRALAMQSDRSRQNSHFF